MLTGRNEDAVLPLLLNRPPVIRSPAPLGSLCGMRVMVTGAGGSIGSELALQIAGMRPARLILVDQSELSLYELNCTLQEAHVEFEVRPLIADVRHEYLIDRLFARESPQIVFHAAALKHVPLLENDHNLMEAVRTNVKGVANIARFSAWCGASMVLISTDKAVNPSSVMGLTKRIGELVAVAEAYADPGLRLSVIRFGNVLGSSGSVVPMFKRQIAQGGPITVTHPEMRRFFMTIKEAVSLVLRVSDSLFQGPPMLSVLEMGEQVLILDLAKQLLNLSGLRWPEDIGIEFIGMRPGEKLAEELNYPKEELRHGQVAGVLECRMPFPKSGQQEQVSALLESADRHEVSRVKAVLRTLEPTYTGWEHWT